MFYSLISTLRCTKCNFIVLPRFLPLSPLQRCMVRATNDNSARRLAILKNYFNFPLFIRKLSMTFALLSFHRHLSRKLPSDVPSSIASVNNVNVGRIFQAMCNMQLFLTSSFFLNCLMNLYTQNKSKKAFTSNTI